MGKIVVVHFQPLEKYPPVMNMLRHLAGHGTENQEIHVITTETEDKRILLEVDGVNIHRIAKWNSSWKRMQRLFFYFRFNAKALLLLRKQMPGKILYYETLSAGAPCLYKQYFNKDCKLFIHYHEYVSTGEYKTGMFINRWFHKLERKWYKKAVWVSHTNEFRVNLFLEDLGADRPPYVYAVPNFPPQSWRSIAEKKLTTIDANKVRFVYVGALSLDTMYVEAFARFIKQEPGKYSWDIYTDNFSPEIPAFFEKLQAPNIHFRGAIEYDRLPHILPLFDIGVILYKGHVPNYVYNAPNKLFEYLACGLDIWFPREMTGSLPYITHGIFPEILSVDFNRPGDLHVMPGKYKKDYKSGKYEYTCENSFSQLVTKLLE